jgi:membrane glycosyltransferase
VGASCHHLHVKELADAGAEDGAAGGGDASGHGGEAEGILQEVVAHAHAGVVHQVRDECRRVVLVLVLLALGHVALLEQPDVVLDLPLQPLLQLHSLLILLLALDASAAFHVEPLKVHAIHDIAAGIVGVFFAFLFLHLGLLLLFAVVTAAALLLHRRRPAAASLAGAPHQLRPTALRAGAIAASHPLSRPIARHGGV